MSNTNNLGDQVHYMSHGSKNGEYEPTCRLAFIAGFSDPGHTHVHLVVLNPTGVYFNDAEYVSYDQKQGGTYHYADESHA